MRSSSSARQGSSHFCQTIVLIQGTEFLEQMIAVGDRTARWRIDERKGLDIVELQRFHAQYDGGQ